MHLFCPLSLRACVVNFNISKNCKYVTRSRQKMKYLNVAEKNDAAKTISALLSHGTARRREGRSIYNKIYEFEATVKGVKSAMVMTSVSGHLLHLEFLPSYRNWNNCDPQQLFDAPVRKSCSEDFLPIKSTLEQEIKSCQGLIIWTDCDREGENIGFEIVDVCKAVNRNVDVYRAKFSEITTASVRKAINDLSPPDKHQSDAVNVRTELDLRTGAAITRLQTLRLQRLFPQKIADKLISYGSCQIPTLGFVVERYKEVEAFISEPFWKIKVTHTIEDLTVDFIWTRNRLFDKETCEDYLMLCFADPKAKVESVTTKPKNKWRPTPMDTVAMEKLGSRKLKLSAKETMTIAEKLYTKGIISYPRTETNQFSKEIDLKSLVQQQTQHSVWGDFAKRVIEWGPNPRNGNKSDQAHPPIHPTKLITNLSGNEAKVYELIVRHFLACVSKDATGSETIVHINIAGEKFTATGLCIFERNFLDVYIYEKWSAKQIHKYECGETFDPTEISMQEGTTSAPPLLTEADLITLMEKHGIGTDATHAEHINTIKERGYIGEVDKGFLVPGVIGMGLYEGYDAMELILAKPFLRAEFESDLKKICLGEKDPQIVLREQILKYKEAYKKITEKISAMDDKIALRINETPAQREETDVVSVNTRIQELFKCPKCMSAPMALKQKKDQQGFFIGCLNFPDCKNVIWLPDELKKLSVKDENCFHCHSDSKMLKVYLTTAYYRNIFNTQSGWYKTCLLCDHNFREMFNINLEQVKQVGTIVSNSSIRTAVQKSSNGKKLHIKSFKLKNNSHSAPKKEKLLKKNIIKESTECNPASIRTYHIEAAIRRESHIGNSPALTFLDSNDGFDDLILAAELPSDENRVNSMKPEMDISNLSDLSDNDFENISWGTAAQRRTKISSSSPKAPDTNYETKDHVLPPRTNNETNAHSWGTSENINRYPMEGALTHYQHGVKCIGCHQLAKELTVKKEGPNKGKLYYSCPKTNPCKFFQWGDESPSSEPSTSAPRANFLYQSLAALPIQESFCAATNTAAVKCGCGTSANSLTVRKEGPNKGRPFYSCANRDNTCGFFKWGDSDILGERGSNEQNSPIINANRKSKKRKCGLCRMEGHTKLKCPRKDEFGDN